MAAIRYDKSRRQIEVVKRGARAAEQQRDWHAAVAVLERLVATVRPPPGGRAAGVG